MNAELSAPPSFLVVGCGSIGQRYLTLLEQHVTERLIACDVAPERLRTVADGVDMAVDDLDIALDESPDVALVATPPASHMSVAEATVSAGCHTLIEKPLSNQLSGVAKLKRLVDETAVRAGVVCNMRFHPGPRTAKQWLDEGRIGEPLYGRFYTGSYLPRWRPGRDYRDSYTASEEEGGAILDCIHELDLAKWMLGAAELETAAVRRAETLQLETDGLGEMILRHEGGALSSVHVNFLQRDYRRQLHLVGETGSVSWSFGDGTVDLYDESGSLSKTETIDPEWEFDSAYVDMLRSFVRAVDLGEEPANPIFEAEATLRLALQARRLGKP